MYELSEGTHLAIYDDRFVIVINIRSIIILLSIFVIFVYYIRSIWVKNVHNESIQICKKEKEEKEENVQYLNQLKHDISILEKEYSTSLHTIQQLHLEIEYENTKWTLNNKILLEKLHQADNAISILTSEKTQLEQTAKESEKLRSDLGHRSLTGFDWRSEMGNLRESLVKHHICASEHLKHGFRMPLPTYVDDVIQTIVDNIQEIEKTEPIMNLFYCSFDDFEFGEPVPNTMVYPGIETYAKVYLMTSKRVYELQGYLKGKPWIDIQPNNWDARGIYLRSSIKQYEVKHLEYGTFYRFHPIAEVHYDVNWHSVSMIINGTKGNIGKAVNRTYVFRNYENGQDEQRQLHFGVNLSSCHILDQTAERYISNIINAVTKST